MIETMDNLDQQIKLQCLSIANTRADTPSEVLQAAKDMYAWVTEKPATQGAAE